MLGRMMRVDCIGLDTEHRVKAVLYVWIDRISLVLLYIENELLNETGLFFYFYFFFFFFLKKKKKKN